MQRKLLLAGVATVALLLAGCGGSSDTATEATTEATAEETTTEEAVTEEESAPALTTDDSNCAAPENFCIGLVTDIGKVDDKSFNQSAWEGAQAAAQGTGGFAKFIETTDPKDYAANLDQFVQKQYDVIVTVGFLMAEATVTAAKANPNVNFVGVDQFQGEDIPNVTGLVFPEDKAGYAAGYLAGLMTQSNKVGAVLGTDTVPPVKLFGEGYKAGILASNPAADVTLVYHPNPSTAFTDPEWGAAEAQKQLAQGNDVIFGAGGNTGNGALIEIAKAPGAGQTTFCIGVDTDQFFTVPQAQVCLLTSAEKKLAQGTQDLIQLAFGGSFPGGNYVGNTGLAPYHDTDAVVPAEVKQQVDAVIAGLSDGTIQTGVTL